MTFSFIKLLANSGMALALLGLSCASLAADHVVEQRNLDFSVKKLAIKVGDSVTFKNEDNVVHNVYSLSDANTFDLGGSPKGKSKSVNFDKAGTIEVECAVHPQMKMIIDVKK